MAKITASPLAAQLSMEPLLVDSNSAEFFQSCLLHVMTHEHASEMVDSRMATNDDDFWGNPDDPDDWLHYYRPYNVIDGVLQIPVMGVLLSQFPWQLGRWATGYKYIEMAFRRGLEDPEVMGFALVINSPGGEVTECFELSDKIYEWRDEKPVRAFCANYAYSAAYNLAAAAGPDNVIITRSGGAGSVGVVTAHVEYSKMLDDIGIKVTYIFAGSHKVDGNPYEALSPAAKKRTQARIDKIYGVFTSTVARNRGMEEEDVRATEALTYDAEEAIEIGFADRIGALDEELVVYATELADNVGDTYMAIQGNATGKKPVGQDDNAQGYTQEQVDAMVAEAKAEGLAEGATAERARYTEIMGLEEAATRPAAASMLVELGVDAATAKAKLAKMPEETKAAVEEKTDDKATEKAKNKDGLRNHFTEAMDKTKNPDISATGGDDDETEGDKSAANTNSILASFAATTGIQKKKTA